MKASISKDFEFSASHRLSGLPEEHQCARLHGHNYVVRITVRGTVVEPGFVIDYGDLAPVKTWIDATLDHRDLNAVIDTNPTAERLAMFIAVRAGEMILIPGRENIEEVSVSVSETPKTWATVVLA